MTATPKPTKATVSRIKFGLLIDLGLIVFIVVLSDYKSFSKASIRSKVHN